MDWIPWVGTAPRAVLGAKVQTSLRPVQRCEHVRARARARAWARPPNAGRRVGARRRRARAWASSHEALVLSPYASLLAQALAPALALTHVCTFARGSAVVAPLHCLFASLWSTEPLGLSCWLPCQRVTVPTCPHAALPRTPSRLRLTTLSSYARSPRNK